MTDPIQTANPQQQGQTNGQVNQPLSSPDDIFAWTDDIFATIPPAHTDEEDLPYGDILEKKYQFNPITEAPAPVQVPVQQVQQVQAPVSPWVELQVVADKELAQINREASLEEIKVGGLLDTKLQTDVQKKFGELFFTTKKIYELKDKLWFPDESFDIIWADNDKIFISYRFLIDETHEPILFITKIEQDKETEEETVNELRFAFNEETNSLEVMINNILLFDEIQDFTEDAKKKMQVVEKINKFTFLASEELRKIEKAIKEKEEAERERRRLQDIFRNF